jgi:hypothetical protein
MIYMVGLIVTFIIIFLVHLFGIIQAKKVSRLNLNDCVVIATHAELKLKKRRMPIILVLALSIL